MFMRCVFIIMVCCTTIVCTSGCSEQQTRFPVAGKVLIDGEPLTTGSIQFVPVGGRPVASKIKQDGSFRLVQMSSTNNSTPPGVAKGKYRIGISASEVINEDQGEILRHIPGRYANFRTSDLEMEISEPQENLVIELTWEGVEETEETAEVSTEKSQREDSALITEAVEEE